MSHSTTPVVNLAITPIDYKVEVRPLKISGDHAESVEYDKYAIVRLDLLKPASQKNGRVKDNASYKMTVLNSCISNPGENHGIKDPASVVTDLVKQFNGELKPTRYFSSPTGDLFSVLLSRVGQGKKGLAVKTIRPDKKGLFTPIRLNTDKILVNFHLLYIHNYQNSQKHGSYYIEVELLYRNDKKADRHCFHIETTENSYMETVEQIYHLFSTLNKIAVADGYGKEVDQFKRDVRYRYTGAKSLNYLEQTGREKSKERMITILSNERLFKSLYGDTLLMAFLAFTKYYYEQILLKDESKHFEYFGKRRNTWSEVLWDLAKVSPHNFV